jgi:hypothetical protein
MRLGRVRERPPQLPPGFTELKDGAVQVIVSKRFVLEIRRHSIALGVSLAGAPEPVAVVRSAADCREAARLLREAADELEAVLLAAASWNDTRRRVAPH